MTNLISLTEADELLVSLDKKKCPWCDGNSWVMRGIPESDADSKDSIFGLRNIPTIKVYKDDNNLKATMNVGVENAMPMIVVRCNDCGFIYLFDYFKLIELSKEKNKERMDNDNDKA
ncbi:hypothetical protein I2492_19555 [Budviciaceae bacterium CWB-B4]|uniref:Uncharacterized protein n=1 Tax=Limnobaculum xujianqingii TaxID=2738837 RepID=A0A9D7FWZ0_9GAMM|nr:hypothetical protein [Limnobaculum xujianqingii]MBK5075202.1 hypothetical protein [Limnobaculum xujianqingii]MBK5178504.1 hypothetical protein [Limnobaculum xujianqingii]